MATPQGEVLITDQAGSLVATMQAVGLEHGDRATIELIGVGVRSFEPGKLTLSYCPAHVRVVRVMTEGREAERQQPIPERVAYTRKFRRSILAAAMGHKGFLTLQANVYSNGAVHLGNPRNVRFEEVLPHASVAHPGDYEAFHS